MENKSFENIIVALLHMRTALTTHVTPSLRAVTVDLDREKEVYICRFFYDGPINEYQLEFSSIAVAEACSDWACDADFLQLDFPAPIPINGALAYLRKEPGESPPEVQLLPRFPRIVEDVYLSYAMQQALLGRVVPALRAVAVNVNEEKETLYFYFYYDEEVTEELLVLSKEAITIAKKAFPKTFISMEEIVFSPFPKRIPSVGGIRVYYRAEPFHE